MCTGVSYRYHCGHEYIEYYMHCPLNIAGNGASPFEKCLIRQASIERQNNLCPRKECKVLSNSWACCACQQGPNTSEKCDQKKGAPGEKCGQELCASCPGWDAFKKRRDAQRKALGSIREEKEEK